MLKTSVLALLFVLTSFCLFAPRAQTSQFVATTASENTLRAIVTAYEKVSEAEEAGANVTSLLAKLDKAGQFLSNAGISNNSMDFYEATLIADEVRSEASELRNTTLQEKLQLRLTTMFASSTTMILIAVGSFWVWHELKRRRESTKAAQQNMKVLLK